MVKPGYILPRRVDDTDPTSPYRCTVTATCKGEAVLQSTLDCDGCEHADAEIDVRLGRKRSELAAHRQAVATVEGHGNPTTDPAVHLALTMGRQRVREIEADLTALTAAYDTVRGEHTHPIFACDGHWSRLLHAD